MISEVLKAKSWILYLNLSSNLPSAEARMKEYRQRNLQTGENCNNMVYLVLEIPIRVTNPCARESVVLKDLDIARESCCNERQICIW